MKTCRICGVSKPIEDYFKHKTSRDGRATFCKVCKCSRQRKWIESRSDERLQLRYNLRRYGIELEEYDQLLARQGGVCALCSKPEVHFRKGKLQSLSVDHDHACCPEARSCGKCVRGLLCSNCNRGLGNFYEDPMLLSAAAQYLEKWAN